MLTSFFRKSKPINFLLMTLVIFFFYFFYNLSTPGKPIDGTWVLEKIGGFIAFLALSFLLNFILVKTKPENRHTFVLLIFVGFCLIFPSLLTDGKTLLAGLFTALGFRRILGLQNDKNISKKIFDAFFFLALASFFFPSTILYLIVPLVGILLFAPFHFRHWLTPFAAILAAFILKTTSSLLLFDQFFNPISFYSFEIFRFEDSINSNILYRVIWLLIFGLWVFFNFLLKNLRTTQTEQAARGIVNLISLTSFGVILLSEGLPRAKGAEFLFLIIPVALISGKYFERPRHIKLKEILLIGFVIVNGLFIIVRQWI